MNEDDDYQVGYKRPPRHSQFKPGENRNPNGRRGKRRKPRAEATDAEIFARLEAETIELQGRRITKREALNRVLYAKALSGDLKAMAMVEARQQKARDASQARRSSVLVVPGTVPLHEWSLSSAIQQAKYRETPDSDEIEADLRKLRRGEE